MAVEPDLPFESFRAEGVGLCEDRLSEAGDPQAPQLREIPEAAHRAGQLQDGQPHFELRVRGAEGEEHGEGFSQPPGLPEYPEEIQRERTQKGRAGPRGERNALPHSPGVQQQRIGQSLRGDGPQHVSKARNCRQHEAQLEGAAIMMHTSP